MINYISGDATKPKGKENKVIVHVCNDIGAWGRGFVLALSKRWAAPEQEYRQWAQGNGQPFRLGDVQFVQVEKDVWVANVIGQHGVGYAQGVPPIRYSALQRGLYQVGSFALENNASVHMPKIGSGLAGGKWETVVKIIEATLGDVDVYVYTPPKHVYTG